MSRLKWQDNVKAVANYHHQECAADESHRISDTANELRISLGAVSQAITLTKYMKHYAKLETFEFVSDALNFIKETKARERKGL